MPVNAPASSPAIGPWASGKLTSIGSGIQRAAQSGKNETGSTFWGCPLCPLTHPSPSPWWPQGQGLEWSYSWIKEGVCLGPLGVCIVLTAMHTATCRAHTSVDDRSWAFPTCGLMETLQPPMRWLLLVSIFHSRNSIAILKAQLSGKSWVKVKSHEYHSKPRSWRTHRLSLRQPLPCSYPWDRCSHARSPGMWKAFIPLSP